MQSREEMKNTAIYEKLINAVKQYFAHKDIYSILLHGGCYWLASALHEYIPDSDIVFHRQMQHCACAFNRGVYDVRGRISARGFRIATMQDMEYMKKHFVPCFDIEAINAYLKNIMQKERTVCYVEN